MVIKKEMTVHLVANGKIILQTPDRNAERAIMRRNASDSEVQEYVSAPSEGLRSSDW